MSYDLGLCIVRYAEWTARRRRLPTWSIVGSILGVGSTSASRFCHEHLPKNGWTLADDKVPQEVLVLTCEDLGDRPDKLMKKGETWYNRKGEDLLYKPRWWKPL